MEECDCISCQESGHPCHMDCDIDEPCLGCFEAAEEAKEREFDEKEALGYR